MHFRFPLPRVVILVLGCVCALAGTGCQRDKLIFNQHVETVNAEYRDLEDQYQVLLSEKQNLESDVHYLRKQLEDAKKGTLGSGRGLFRQPTAPSSDGSLTPDDDPTMSPPVIEGGESVSPDEILPMNRGSGTDSTRRPNWSPTPSNGGSPTPSKVPGRLSHTTKMPPLSMPERYEDNSLPVQPKPAPAEEDSEPTEAELPPPAESSKPTPANRAPELIDEKVSQLYLHPVYTGIAKQEQEGTDGIRILIEPQNRQGQFVPRPGKVTIVALDPTRQGDAARLARWEFEATAVSHMLTTSGAKRGIYLQLPWPGQAPAGDQLQLFVRFQQGDAPALEVEREIATHLHAPTLERWVRRAPKSAEERFLADEKASQPTATNDHSILQASAEEPIEQSAAESAEPQPTPAPKRPRAWSSTR